MDKSIKNISICDIPPQHGRSMEIQRRIMEDIWGKDFLDTPSESAKGVEVDGKIYLPTRLHEADECGIVSSKASGLLHIVIKPLDSIQ